MDARAWLAWVSLAALFALFLALQIITLEKVLQLHSLRNLTLNYPAAGVSVIQTAPVRSTIQSRPFSSLLRVMEYNDAVFTLTRKAAGDPFMVFAHDKYYLTFTGGKKVRLWRCDHILDFTKKRNVTAIWEAPAGTEHSASLWAPELHAVSGRWYIYVSGTPEAGSKHHRQFVLEGPSETQDPINGPWKFLGRIRGMPDVWAIDGTCFKLDGQLYFAYSGRPPTNKPNTRGRQSIFIFKMSDPVTAASKPVMISTPTEPWEFVGNVGTEEGPQWLEDPNGSWRGIVFSCGRAATPQYKMATLKYLGGDPLKPDSWQKSAKPLLRTKKGRAPFGPGHGNFVTTGDEVLAIFHATDSPTDGLANRRVRAQKVIFNDDGPFMNGTVGELTNDLEKFTRGAKPAPHPSLGKRGIHATFNAPRKGDNEVLFDASVDQAEDSDPDDRIGRYGGDEDNDDREEQ